MRELLRAGRRLFWRPSVDEALDEELSAHLEQLVQRLEREGKSPADARAAALRRFGDPEQVRRECRELANDVEAVMTRKALWQELRQDAAYGLRTLRHAPLFSAIAVLTLAIGIGASTAIFSVVHGVLLRALPYDHADRVITIWNGYRQGGAVSTTAIAPPEFADITEQARTLDAVAAIGRAAANLSGDCPGSGTCEPERANGYAVSPNLFRLLGARTAIGRDFNDAEGAPGTEPVVLLSHALWRRRYGGDSAVIGRAININGTLRTVIGVMPPAVRFPDAPVGFLRERADLWVPRNATGDRGEERGNQFLGIVARRSASTSPEQLRTDLESIAARFRAAFPGRYDQATVRWGLQHQSLRDEMVGESRRPLLIVLGAVLLLMLIASANVAHLSLARGSARRQEFAVRAALGAGRLRLVRQLVTENLLLGGAATALAVAGATIATRGLVGLAPDVIPNLDQVRLNAPVLGFALLLGIASAVLVGLIPALRQSQVSVQDALRSGGRSAAAGPRRRVRSVLVVAEVAMALVILVGAGLLTRSLLALQRVDPGFRPGPALTFAVTLPRARYDSPGKLAAFHAALQERLAAIAGVEAVSAVDPLPLGGNNWSGTFHVEGLVVPPGGQDPHAEYAVALPGFVDALRMRLVRGREFTPADGRDAPAVVVVDERLAARYFPGQDPIGRRVSQQGAEGPFATIVGVVGHVYRSGPAREGEPQIYFPFAQHVQAPLSYVLRTSTDPLSLVRSVRGAVSGIDPALPIARVATMASLEQGALARERFNALLLALFAVTALLLAAIGLYGVMAYLVSQRLGEIGIRLALGGRPRDVVRLVIGEGMLMAAIGIAIGAAAALALGRLIEGMLHGVTPTDPLTFVAIAVTLAVVSFVASALPARRATRADPVRALRG